MHFHLPPGSRIIPTADERLRQELIQFCTYKVTNSRHVLKYCVETIPETGSYPVCSFIGCSFLLTEVEDSSTRSSTMLLKILPYRTADPNPAKCGQNSGRMPDLAGFPKKGRMPDLPEPKSGTSLLLSRTEIFKFRS